MVVAKHTLPNLLSSLFFVILLRILGAENKGKVIAILPFKPWKLLGRLSRRGLDFTNMPTGFIEDSSSVTFEQASSYLFIYFLCTMSVKVYCNKLFGVRPRAEGGLFSLMDSPQGRKMAQAMGVDPDDLKFD